MSSSRELSFIASAVASSNSPAAASAAGTASSSRQKNPTSRCRAARRIARSCSSLEVSRSRGSSSLIVRSVRAMSTSTDARERIEDLAGRIVELRDAYYRGEPLVADADYDPIEDELRGLLAAHPELTPDPNPLETVGAPTVLHAPVRHSRPMLSLEKATTPEQVAAFFARFPGQPVVVMPKLDGLSLALVYEDGRLARAVTRGDGTTGDDVTMLVAALAEGVPATVAAEGRVEVRGELVMLRSTFAKYNAEHPDKPLINPRNAAAGTVRAKDPAAVAGRNLHFFAFDLDASDGAPTDLEDGLKSLGFDAAEMRHCDDAAAAQAVIGEIEATRNDLDYDL